MTEQEIIDAVENLAYPKIDTLVSKALSSILNKMLTLDNLQIQGYITHSFNNQGKEIRLRVLNGMSGEMKEFIIPESSW